MKVRSVKDGEIVWFEDFYVKQEKDYKYHIYTRNGNNNLISCGETLEQACLKAKFLQIGYNLAQAEYV